MRIWRRSRAWYQFTRDPFSAVGLAIVVVISLATALAPFITPYPEHAGMFVDFKNASASPDWSYVFGTDNIGRDVFSRLVFAYRVSFGLGVVVLGIAVPVGVVLGLIGGYYGGRIETVVMRVTDIFLALPPLVLGMAILGVLPSSMVNVMIAIAALWWPWHTRMVYSLTRSIRTEDFVVAAKIIGASDLHILFHEILPNCVPSILTKVTLDMAFVIIIVAALGFVGLGVQPPTPDLGRMVAEGMDFITEGWWMPVFPSIGIMVIVLGFSLLGDGIRDVLHVEVS